MIDLDKTTVIQSSQKPAIVCWVPINVFIVECVFALALFKAFGFFVIAFLPIHFYFTIKTSDDPHWVSTSIANLFYTRFGWNYVIRNKGLHGADVITFSANPIRGNDE